MYRFRSLLFCSVPPSLGATLLSGRPSCSSLVLQGLWGDESLLQKFSADFPRSQSTFPPGHSFPTTLWQFIHLIIHQNRYRFLAAK